VSRPIPPEDDEKPGAEAERTRGTSRVNARNGYMGDDIYELGAAHAKTTTVLGARTGVSVRRGPVSLVMTAVVERETAVSLMMNAVLESKTAVVAR